MTGNAIATGNASERENAIETETVDATTRRGDDRRPEDSGRRRDAALVAAVVVVARRARPQHPVADVRARPSIAARPATETVAEVAVAAVVGAGQAAVAPPRVTAALAAAVAAAVALAAALAADQTPNKLKKAVLLSSQTQRILKARVLFLFKHY